MIFLSFKTILNSTCNGIIIFMLITQEGIALRRIKPW